VRSRWNFPIYIGYLIFSLLVIGYIIAQVGIAAPWSHQFSVTAKFTNAADILVNNEVFMNGTKIGHIGAVDVVNGEAKVQLVIDNGHALPLHSDASAEVRKKNLLGETYIDLQRGSGVGDLSDGSTIPSSRTVPITEVDQVLAIFDPETVQRLQLLINALGDATINNGQNMNAEAASMNQLLTTLNTPAMRLSVRQQQVQDIVRELERFYKLIADQRGQIRDGFKTWNDVMAQMAQQESSIGGTLQQADALLTNLNLLVNGETSNIRSLLTNLTPTLKSANGFLDQANLIGRDIAPYRQYIADIFPGLQTSFTDTDAFGNHMWGVYSANCYPANDTYAAPKYCSGTVPSSATGSPNDIWAGYGGSGQ